MNYQKKANLVLTAVFILFIGAAVIEHSNPHNFGIRLVYFVLEAALVGGIADWFAVTAIFKKPLGWGFHTALIPRNREKVIEAVASMVQSELLRVDLIRQKIEGVPFIESLVNYVKKEGGSVYLTNKLTPYLQRYIERQSPDQLAKKLSMYLRENAKTWHLAPKVEAASGWALHHGYMDQGLDQLAEGLWDKASQGETRQVILRYLEEIKQEKVSNGGSIFRTLLGFVEMSDGLNLEEAADALQVELLLTLRKLKDQNHPMRVTLRDNLMGEIVAFAQDPEFEVQIERWKDDLLKEHFFEDFLEIVIETAINTATSPSLTSEPNALQCMLHFYLEKYWVSIQENKALRDKVNSFIVDTLCRVIKNEHDMIGLMVRETLAAYTDQDLNQFVQDKAGNDLQWIRINGSMIGGIVGFILFLFLEFVYNPLIMSVLTNYTR
ncbi:DUF445 domain-containing protein [Desulfosporosinus shakirovi]|uniref:DUF445 domain-containing protein n=1 Tax=Desulfosporosinus shakirovi TaxID=2885154 RepID=UPI001E3CD22F|nr:DUF445 domain-containing protein [Desulfosporosinus sp. SRJS8]MCB8817193.1 DUF445 domain-containing protein [Desulfosporosinus sp. SRJS8]